MSEASRTFLPVENPDEARRYLNEATKTLAPAIIWTQGQESSFQSHIHTYSEVQRVFYTKVPDGVDPLVFRSALQKSGTQDCLFSLSLTKANLFFKATFLSSDTLGLRFQLPKQLFKVQRRKAMRFTIPDGISVKLTIENPIQPNETMDLRVLDLSASGLSFQVSEVQQLLFTEGSVLKGMRLSLRGKSIVMDGEIRHRRGERVGLQFAALKAADAQWIATFVFDETRKYFSKFV